MPQKKRSRRPAGNAIKNAHTHQPDREAGVGQEQDAPSKTGKSACSASFVRLGTFARPADSHSRAPHARDLLTVSRASQLSLSLITKSHSTDSRNHGSPDRATRVSPPRRATRRADTLTSSLSPNSTHQTVDLSTHATRCPFFTLHCNRTRQAHLSCLPPPHMRTRYRSHARRRPASNHYWICENGLSATPIALRSASRIWSCLQESKTEKAAMIASGNGNAGAVHRAKGGGGDGRGSGAREGLAEGRREKHSRIGRVVVAVACKVLPQRLLPVLDRLRTERALDVERAHVRVRVELGLR